MVYSMLYIYIISMEQSEDSHETTQQSLHKHQHTFQSLKGPAIDSGIMSKSIQKGRQTRFHFERVINFDYCLLVFSLINIALSILYSDASWQGKSNVANFCLNFMFGTLFIQILVTVYRYKAQVALEKSQKILDVEQTIFTSDKGGFLFLQIFILVLQPYPFLEGVTVSMVDNYDGFQFDYKFNYILVFLGFGKLFIILRVILTGTVYMSPRSSRLCRMYGCEANYLYAIKCLFKDTPMLLIGIVFICSILIFALSLRIAQRDVQTIYNTLNDLSPGASQKTGTNDVSDFSNALWLTIITMTTVGYGDYFPRTTFGRVIDVILVVWGTFIVSLMVVVLTNTLNMDPSQKRALIVLNRLQAKKELKEAAALLITHSCKKYLLKKAVKSKKRSALTKEEEGKLETTFYKYLTNFQGVHRIIRSMYQIDDVYEQMTRQFEFINDQINFLLSSQKDTIGNLQQYLQSNSIGLNEKQRETI